MSAGAGSHVEMLVSACRLTLGTAVGPRGMPIDDGQWRGVLAAALDHGLIGPLERATKRHAPPANILCSIQTAARVQTAQNLHFVAALIEIVRYFRSHGIEAVVLKGPAIAQITCGQLGIREFTDLDLLVRSDDLNRATFDLASLGYRRVCENVADSGGPHRQKDTPFVRDVDGVLVELHWNLNPRSARFPLEITGVWSRVQTVCIQNEEIHTLGLEDTLLALCIHGSIHGWASLKWVLDIARILQRKSDALDWDAALRRSTVAHCNRSLLAGIHLASFLFGVEAPEVVTAWIRRDTSAIKLAERLSVSLLSDRPLTDIELIALRIQMHERLWDRIVLVAGVLCRRLRPTAADPISARPLRFVLRFTRLLRFYGLGWLRSAIVAR